MNRRLSIFFKDYSVFYFITYFGSSLTTITTFLLIEKTFNSLENLGLALSLKTLFLYLISSKVSKYLGELKLVNGIVLSQIIGLIVLPIIYLGMTHKLFPLILIGLILSGIPGLMLNIISTTFIRILSGGNESDFRKTQGKFQILASSTFFVCGLLSPFLLSFMSFKFILIIDFISFLLGLAYLGFTYYHYLNFETEKLEAGNSPVKNITKEFTFLNINNVYLFFMSLGVMGVYLLKGLPPLFSGTSKIGNYFSIPLMMRQSIWSLEPLAGIVAGVIYKKYQRNLKNQSITFFLYFNSIFILALLIKDNYFINLFSIFILCLSMLLGYMLIRDEFILQFENKNDLLRASGFINGAMNCAMAVSPIILSFLISHTSMSVFCFSIISIQVFMLLVYRIYKYFRFEKGQGESTVSIFTKMNFKYLSFAGILLSIFVGASLYIFEVKKTNKQVETLVSTLNKSVLQNIIESDFVPIFNKVNILKDTQLLTEYYLSNQNKLKIASFGIDDQTSNNLHLVLHPIYDDNHMIWGYYHYKVDISSNLITGIWMFLIVLFVVSLISFLFALYINKKIEATKSNYSEAMLLLKNTVNKMIESDNFDDIENSFDKTFLHSVESIEISIVFKQLLLALKNKNILLLEKQLNAQKIDTFIEIASQVSHDIRSPLSALNMTTKLLNNIPEEHRVLIRNSVSRINDIANQLLTKSIEKRNLVSLATDSKSVNESTNNLLSVELIPAIIDVIVSEKRIQHREKNNIIIESNLEESYGSFAKINSREFKRVISNLINNAVEALNREDGRVIVKVQNMPSKAILNITDNGAGIPKYILEKLGQIGISHGKEGTESGSGLGVYHAKKTIETFNGKFEIFSKEGHGTDIRIEIPSCDTPKWFVPVIHLNKDQIIVALDDDNSILEIWKQKFKEFNIKLITYTSEKDLINWVDLNSDQLKNTLFLMDYELLNQKYTGLELIEKLNLNNKAVLVTSRYEENHIKSKCEELDVRQIPKGMASLVPIEFKFSQANDASILNDEVCFLTDLNLEKTMPTINSVSKIRYDLCLIDDDIELVHAIWGLEAKNKGLNIKLFSTPQAFLTNADSIDRNTPIYVDVSLGEGIMGTDVAMDIYKLGFIEINLATGYNADLIDVPFFVKNVIGKEFPFL